MTTKISNAKTSIRLIATDLDGTLLNPAMGLPKENREALERCAADGVTIVVATGRSLSTVPESVRGVALAINSALGY